MTWQWSPLMIPLLIGVFCCIVFAVYVARLGTEHTRVAALLMATGAVWLVGHTLEIGSVDLQTKAFWMKAQYFSVALLPTIWIGFVLQYTGRERWLTPPRLIGLASGSLIFILLVFTTDSHGLMWRSVMVQGPDGMTGLKQHFGIGFWVFVGYASIVIWSGIVLLLRMFLHVRLLYRRQIRFMVLGAMIVSAMILVDVAGLNPFPDIDPEPLAFSIVALIVVWGLLRVRVGDIVPVAHATVIEGMADGIIVLDAKARILNLNLSAMRLMGVENADFVGQPLKALQPEWGAAFTQRLGQETAAWSQEVTLTVVSRSQIFDARVSQLRDGRGALVSHVMVLRDITERKQAELEVRERHRHLEAVWGAVPDAIVVLDPTQRIVEWNVGAERLFGYPKREALGQDIKTLINNADTLAEAEGFLRTIWEGAPLAPVEAARCRRDGSMVNVMVAGSPIIVDARFVGAVNVYTDITRRKHIEEDIRALNEELEARVIARTGELATVNRQLAVEVEKHEQAEATLLQRNRELLSLQSAATATSSSLDLPFLLDTVTWEMTNLLQSSGCVIFEWNPDTDKIISVADYEASLGEVPVHTESQNLSDYPLRERVLTERYAEQVSLGEAGAAEQASMAQRDVKSQLLLPMAFQDHVVGLVIVTERERERVFSDREISLGQLLANQAATAVENARLYERAQREITERVRAEAKIKASLKEKEILLQEIHHRVKNNLQVISSLLNLQSQGIQDTKTLEIFQESQNRIRSMALIHEKLYRSQDLARVDFAEYIRNLASFLIRSYRSRAVRLDLRAGDVFLSIDNAVPCGLIVNELISNALKHAFVDGREGEIRVILRQANDHQVQLIVGDNGVGLPTDVDYMNTGSLGLQLVDMLVQQLDGTLEIRNNVGAEFEITFAGV